MSLRVLLFWFPLFPTLWGEGICFPPIPTRCLGKPGVTGFDSLYTLNVKGQNVNQNIPNDLFSISLSYQKETAVLLPFVFEFVFCHAQCCCCSCCTVSVQFWSCFSRKIFVNVRELLIGQFLRILHVYFGFFSLVRPNKFPCNKHFYEKGENCHFDTFPPTLNYTCRSARCQNSEAFGGLSWVRCGIWVRSESICGNLWHGISSCSSQESIPMVLIVLIT